MTEEEIEKLKDKIDDGAAMAHDPMCSEGFSAARELIKYYEEQCIIMNAHISFLSQREKNFTGGR